jgi:GDPmannose 4,6-dehydratase
MKAIIYGANGQDGYYLGKLLSVASIELINVSRSGDFLHTDISNWNEVSELIRLHKPDYVFHLAALSTTQHFAWQENNSTISTGALYLLEAVHRYSPDSRVFLSGSGLQFRNDGKPIKESDPFDATSMYAVSRIHTVYMARYYRKLGIKVYVGYFFNHDSPLRSDKHVSRKITEAVKRIAAGQAEKIRIGDASVKKEWGYAGDIAKAIWVLVKQDLIFEATIGTGMAYSIEDWIEACFEYVHLDPSGSVEQEEGFKSEYRILVSDPTTIFSLGWRPEVSFKQLAQMMMD